MPRQTRRTSLPVIKAKKEPLDWAGMATGTVWEIVSPGDFTGTPESFLKTARQNCRKLGLKLDHNPPVTKSKDGVEETIISVIVTRETPAVGVSPQHDGMDVPAESGDLVGVAA